MKKILIVCLCGVALSVVVISCKKMQEKDVIKSETPILKEVASTQHSIEASLKEKIVGRFGKVKRRSVANINKTTNSISDPLSDMSFDNPTTASYVGSDIQAVLFEQPNSVPGNTFSFVTFTQNGLLGDMAMIVQSEQLSSTLFRASIYDLDYNLIGQFLADNGQAYNFQGFDPPPPVTSVNGWWGRWGHCIANAFNGFFDGNPIHAAAGLACTYFAGPCIVGGSLGCAASATFN
jgi:hypothetical protein